MKRLIPSLILAASAASPLVAQAEIYEFNALLNASSEIPLPSVANAAATGLATLTYDDVLNTYDFSLSAFSLSGVVEGAHIHALATDTEAGPVVVDLTGAPFVTANPGSVLLIGGDDVGTPGQVAASNGHAEQSFLDALQSGLAYINIHTAAFPGGEIRGQLSQVEEVTTPVPEPENWAMMLAGMGLIGFVARRRLGV